ncbi:transcription termination/antitermination NusG family protein [Acetonema longum]|uniref:transcription termination/antitermination NusG family protein n=1 Tax=Acetonema longum TaxID=2374 RepID=UPI000590799A|nr:transcription termination/antitermination NusG family protein [Acetonema longum]
MEWYVLRTISGKEETALTILHKLFSDVKLICPKRRISWRKQGSIISIVRPLFEGYLFVASPAERLEEFYNLLRMYKLNIAWPVYSAGALVPIYTEEQLLIQKLIGNGGIVEVSTLKKQNEQLQVVNGPLLGLDHIIKKVSPKNRRIMVEVTVLDEKKKIELEGVFVT